MNKWVCINKNWNDFTYGKIYEGGLQNSILDIESDNGERLYPSLYGIGYFEMPYMAKTSKLCGRRIYNFIPLEEWRQQQIEKII